ncbi:MAG TPA: universal stress protein [Candidatus Limnocylindrales bacterium]|jgi:nucleotide-binding universal stress UspA family protein
MKALIAIDGSNESADAVGVACGLHWPEGSSVQLLHVIPTDLELSGGPLAGTYSVPSLDEVRGRLVEEGHEILEHAIGRLEAAAVEVGAEMLEGRAATVILERAAKMEADLIVVGSRGLGAIGRMLLGSVSAELVDRAQAAVLVARRPGCRRILIGTDGSEDGTSAVRFVAETGLFTGTETRVVHAIDLHPVWWTGFPPGAAAMSNDASLAVTLAARERGHAVTEDACKLLRSAGLATSWVVREEPAAQGIANEAASWDADLIVVGTRGHGLLKRMVLGSTARWLAHRAETSVLVTRPVPVRPATSGASSAATSAHPIAV